MIPLGDWLAQRQAVESGLVPPGIGDPRHILPEQVEAAHARAIDEAYERGRSESDAASQDLLQRTLSTERERHAEELQVAQTAWRSADIAALADNMTSAYAALHESLAEQTAAALAGFLEGGARIKALNAFRAALDDLAEIHPLIRVEGPDELIAALQAHGPLPAGIELRPSAQPGLRAVAGDTTVEMALQRWLDAMHGDHP
jgi:hypothetical protein